MKLTPGYQIPKKPESPPTSPRQDSPPAQTHSQQSDRPASPPAQSGTRQTVVPELEGEGLEGRRWFTKTRPQILVVEAKARATIERLLERSQPSEEIPTSGPDRPRC